MAETTWAHSERRKSRRMAAETSELQRRIFQFLIEYSRKEGMPPTNREIGKAMNIASTGHVDYHLTMLEKRGLISREPKKSRGIKINQPFGVPIKGNIAAGEPLEIYNEPEQMVDVGRDLEQQNTYALI